MLQLNMGACTCTRDGHGWQLQGSIPGIEKAGDIDLDELMDDVLENAAAAWIAIDIDVENYRKVGCKQKVD
jgi:hypothetical protein